MAKFHINPRTGNPGACRALNRCPFGGESEHYASEAEAREAYEASMEESFKYSDTIQPGPASLRSPVSRNAIDPSKTFRLGDQSRALRATPLPRHSATPPRIETGDAIDEHERTSYAAMLSVLSGRDGKSTPDLYFEVHGHGVARKNMSPVEHLLTVNKTNGFMFSEDEHRPANELFDYLKLHSSSIKTAADAQARVDEYVKEYAPAGHNSLDVANRVSASLRGYSSAIETKGELSAYAESVESHFRSTRKLTMQMKPTEPSSVTDVVRSALQAKSA